MKSLLKNCKNCYYGGFNCCLFGQNGERLDQRNIKQSNGYDEYNSCPSWKTSIIRKQADKQAFSPSASTR